MSDIAAHTAPVWGPKADFLIRADLEKFGLSGRSEQLWARNLGESVFEVCCVPFFTRGISLGDHVQCDAEHAIVSVVKKGGHKTFLVVVANRQRDEARLHELLHGWADSTGLLYEFCAPGYLAVDVPARCNAVTNLGTLEAFVNTGEVAIELDG